MSIPEQEIWKQIPGFEKNQASNLGRIKGKKNKTLSLFYDRRTGYFQCAIYDNLGVRKRFYVHRLIAMTFLGEIPKKYQVAHNDGCRKNNELSNLRICTVKENLSDKIKHGTDHNGPKSGMSKLSWEQVKYIRNSDKTIKDLSSQFSLHFSTVYRILSNTTYRSEFASE